MSGTAFIQALLLLAAVVILVAGTRRHLHPFLALVVIACAFGLAAGFSIGALGRVFSAGFSQAIYAPGLVIVAAGLVSGLGESTGASDRLAALVDRMGPAASWLAAPCGLIAGIAASPAAAFAILTPLLRRAAGQPLAKRGANAIALALAISASHGLILFSPVAIAAVSILDAPWWRVALFGVPVAAVLAVLAAASARWWPAAAPAAQLSIPAPTDAQKHGGGSAAVVLLATILPLLLLIVRSLGDIPSEPFGGGQKRELILGLGSPLALFVAGVGIMAIGQWRSSRALFGDSTWTQHIFGNVAGLLLIVGAAGGLQKLCQETGMAELLGERLLEWHIGPLGGLLIPFLIAALIKTLQGSSLVAAITTAGMVQPLLLPLGVGDESGRALASLSVGIGAMTCSHINDEFFWVATGSAGLSPARGLAMLTVGTLLQGAVAVGALLLLFALASIV